jgi:hypothetical protein
MTRTAEDSGGGGVVGCEKSVPIYIYIISALYFYARGQICPPRADLPAPIWGDHFFHY